MRAISNCALKPDYSQWERERLQPFSNGNHFDFILCHMPFLALKLFEFSYNPDYPTFCPLKFEPRVGNQWNHFEPLGPKFISAPPISGSEIGVTGALTDT